VPKKQREGLPAKVDNPMTCEGKALSGLTILVVEDEFLIATDVQRVVEDAGAHGTILANSIAGVRNILASGKHIDACILDLRLGSEDGSLLAEEFEIRGIPVVVASGFDTGRVGVVTVQKPYRDAELIEGLLKVLSPAAKR
jgi:DNA-binding NtrC family response regulator